jgi:hypothetical protein
MDFDKKKSILDIGDKSIFPLIFRSKEATVLNIRNGGDNL